MRRRVEVKIAFAAPLSGDQAIVGGPMACCAELAIARANAEARLPFELVLRAEDDRADPGAAEAVARRLVEDPAVIGLVGHKNSGPSASAAPIYHAAGLIQISPSSTNPALSQRGYATFFRMCAHDGIQGAVAARYAVRVLGARYLAVIHDHTDYGLPLAQAFQAAAETEGAEVALVEGIRAGAQDFAETVTRISRQSLDLVYFALTEIESSLLAGQLRRAGIGAVLFGTDGGPDSKFVALAGEAAEGTYHTYAGTVLGETPAAQAFVREFTARYGAVPVYGGEVYDAANLIIEALSQTGRPERAALAARVVASVVEGVTGAIRFAPNGDRVEPQVSIWKVDGGTPRLLGPGRDLVR